MDDTTCFGIKVSDPSEMRVATYHVDASDSRYRALTVGDGYPPTMDASALLGSWHREGFKYLSRDLARHLGALVAVVRDPADVSELTEGGDDGTQAG